MSYVRVVQDHLYTANLLSRGLGEAVLHCPVQLVLAAHIPPLFLVQVGGGGGGMCFRITFMRIRIHYPG